MSATSSKPKEPPLLEHIEIWDSMASMMIIVDSMMYNAIIVVAG